MIEAGASPDPALSAAYDFAEYVFVDDADFSAAGFCPVNLLTLFLLPHVNFTQS